MRLVGSGPWGGCPAPPGLLQGDGVSDGPEDPEGLATQRETSFKRKLLHFALHLEINVGLSIFIAHLMDEVLPPPLPLPLGPTRAAVQTVCSACPVQGAQVTGTWEGVPLPRPDSPVSSSGAWGTGGSGPSMDAGGSGPLMDASLSFSPPLPQPRSLEHNCNMAFAAGAGPTRAAKAEVELG